MLHIVYGLRKLRPITSINKPSQISQSLHRFLNLNEYISARHIMSPSCLVHLVPWWMML